MSLRAQFQQLQQQRSDFCLDIFGATAAMDDAPDATFACYYSPVSESEILMPFGIKNDFDLVLRVPKTETNFVPEIGKNVKVMPHPTPIEPTPAPFVTRLVKPRVHALGLEHVFECQSQS